MLIIILLHIDLRRNTIYYASRLFWIVGLYTRLLFYFCEYMYLSTRILSSHMVYDLY